MIATVEKEIGSYKLPEAYIELMRIQNGRYLQQDYFITGEK